MTLVHKSCNRNDQSMFTMPVRNDKDKDKDKESSDLQVVLRSEGS
jgi:hypothetical protein